MNRPPKKHKQHKDELLRDPRFDQKDLENARGATSAAAGDDRNLVSIDDAMAGADVSDKLWLLWERNKNIIIIALLAVVVAISGYFAVRYIRAQAHGSMQEAYVQAQGNPAALASFAAEYSNQPLGGSAFLQLADEAYQSGDFAKAADLYASAATGLQQTDIYGRALLGQGIALARADRADEARRQLGSLVENTSVLGALRAQAAFDLIVLEISSGQQDAARAWLKRIVEIPDAGIWVEQAASYASQHGLSVAE